MKWISEHFIACVVFVVLATYLMLGVTGLSRYVTTDEQFWVYGRIPKYWNGIKQMNFEKTHINDKPGVSLALVSGTALPWVGNPDTHRIQDDTVLDQYHIEQTEPLYFSFRLPLLLFNSILLLYLVWIVNRVTTVWVALWTFILTAFSPVLFGMSRIVNPDALLWSFSACALFSYLALLKTDERKFLFLTALFTGLALLSKYVATILFVFFFVTFLWQHANTARGNSVCVQKIQKQAIDLFLIFFGAIVIFVLLMPAALLKPQFLYDGTIGFSGFKPFVIPMVLILLSMIADASLHRGRFLLPVFHFIQRIRPFISLSILMGVVLLLGATLVNWMTHEGLQSLNHIPIDARSSEMFTKHTSLVAKMLLESYPLVFSVTPFVVVLIFSGWFLCIFSRNKQHEHDWLFPLFSLFLVIFLVGGILSDVLLTTRYMIILFPMMSFLAALSLFRISALWTKQRVWYMILTLCVLIASLISLLLIRPFYYNYASFLLPKEYIVSSAWGFGGYEAAQYLNSLPVDQDRIVWSDYRGVCEFLVGKCIVDRAYDKGLYPVEYYVLTRRGQSRSDNHMLNSFEERGIQPEWSLLIDNRSQNYISIYRNSESVESVK